MKRLDCLGEMCPVPIIRIKQALKTTKPNDSFLVITDHSCVLESISNYFNTSKIKIEPNEVMNGVWEILITKY